jgi:hypothetical protein
MHHPRSVWVVRTVWLTARAGATELSPKRCAAAVHVHFHVNGAGLERKGICWILHAGDQAMDLISMRCIQGTVHHTTVLVNPRN